MFLQMFRPVLASCLGLLVSVIAASAQIVVDGVVDKGTYDNSVTYRVQAQAGFTDEAFLNGQPVPVGVQNTITRPDFYQLFIQRTDNASSAVTTRLVRFLVNAGERNGSEWGLPRHTPAPMILSSSAEFTGARLRLMIPNAFPSGYDIPVVAWAMNENNHPVRANGLLAAQGHPSVLLRRGVCSGFLAATNPAGSIVYAPTLGGIATNKTINIESSTIWTTVSGVLGDTTWPANSRIHVTGSLTVPAGEIGRAHV